MSGIARKLGFAESFLHRFYEEINAGLVTVVMARLKQSPSVMHMEQGVTRAWAQHPLLRNRILRSDKGLFHFSEIQAAEPPVVQESELPARDLFQQLMGSPFQSEKPLWSITFTSNPHPHVLLKIHHAIADGTAARSLLCSIAGVSSSLKEQDRKPYVIHPPVEQLMAANRDSTRQPLPPPGNFPVWLYLRKAPVKDRMCKAIFMEVDCTSLLQKAHENNVSLNGLMMAAVVRAANVLPAFPGKTALILPVNVRQMVQPAIGNDEMGCYIGNALVYSNNESGEIPSLQLAVNLNEQLQRVMQTAVTAPEKFDSSMLDQSVLPFADPDRGHFGFNLALSNLGQQPRTDKNMEALWFGASVCPGHLGILVTANTIGSNMCLGLNFAEPLVESKSVALYSERLLEELG